MLESKALELLLRSFLSSVLSAVCFPLRFIFSAIGLTSRFALRFILGGAYPTFYFGFSLIRLALSACFSARRA